jgi:Fe-S-cluster-containing hydrogenase component 2
MEIQGEECWRCQHCLAVCPQGAISIFGKKPEDSLPPAPKEMGEYMEQLIVNRRSCRRFLDQNVGTMGYAFLNKHQKQENVFDR